MVLEKKVKIFFCLFVILILAGFFRLWQLNNIPPGLYPDVAINGNDALQSLKTGNFKVFYPENNGREGLFIWLVALSFSIFGVSICSIKIVAAIIGILTIFGLYLLTKELFLNQRLKVNGHFVALLAGFFLAISFWHVNFSRIGFRAILLPFILVFGFYFLLKFLNYLKNQSQQNYIRLYGSVILAGVIFGLGFYTYPSFRMAILILPSVLIPYWFFYKKQNLQKKFLSLIIGYLLLIILVALPLGIYFFKNPHHFISRATGISIFAQQNPISALGKSLILHLGMFNFYGDTNWRHNFSGSPLLFWPIGILFLIGLFYSLFIFAKSIISPKMGLSFSFVYFFLISWWFIMLLPGILTSEGIPHALRTIGVIPVVYIFAGLGSWNVYRWLKKNTKQKKLLFLVVLLFLFMTVVVEFDKYFKKWSQNPEVKNAFSTDYVEMGNYLNSLPEEIQKYVIVNQPGVPVPWPDGIPMPAQTVMFVENVKYGKTQSIYLLPKNLDIIKIDKPTVIIPMKYQKELFDNLQKKFPQGEIHKENHIRIYKINL